MKLLTNNNLMMQDQGYAVDASKFLSQTLSIFNGLPTISTYTNVQRDSFFITCNFNQCTFEQFLITGWLFLKFVTLLNLLIFLHVWICLIYYYYFADFIVKNIV